MTVGLLRVFRRWIVCIISWKFFAQNTWFFLSIVILYQPWGISAVGSAPHWQCGGHGFESRMLHQKEKPPTRRFFFLYFSLLSLLSSLLSAVLWRLFQIREKREKWKVSVSASPMYIFSASPTFSVLARPIFSLIFSILNFFLTDCLFLSTML